ncbi:adenosylmethionine--8-amino-7-oxononanoate transaminase [Compostibacter hankyongensis]|uniref:Adenosylmethionine-8-amino-7-oxononanoate aminotransferase n=1 Tax=Compostibacter hankyongensis TaxID=1007089 RepID=A0ABP8FRN2_9BACT
MNDASYTERDLAVIWHPYTQMQTALPPVAMVSGKDALLYDDTGQAYIDAVSSWWVSIHGHGNAYIAEKIAAQAGILEHCIFAGFTHPPAVILAERLLGVLPDNQRKIFYSDNGSTAVEVALKMSIQYWHNQGIRKNKFIAFKHAYHGDTFGAMSVSGRSIFTRVFDDYLFDVVFLDLPTPENITVLCEQIAGLSAEACAFIFEPLVLGSGGMLMYTPEMLGMLMQVCRQHDILTIADEVMTGFGRTGKNFALEYCSGKPDIICLSKGLSGGTLAFGVTTCTQDIYDVFLSDDKLKTLFHGHSFTANPVACAAALASLDLFTASGCQDNIRRITEAHQRFSERLKGHRKIKNLRQQGTIIAFEIVTPEADAYTNSMRDRLYKFFLDRKIILRPLGNTLYIMPPYTITDAQLETVYSAIMELIAQS